MIGQSNMAGRGNIADVEPIDNFRCYMQRNGRFIRMREPINVDRPVFGGGFTSGISLAASFADEFANVYNDRVGLIPCADGGTSIGAWQRGEILYDHAVFMTKLAMRTSTFSGFLWHQGESDSMTEESVCAYKSKLIKLISDLRADIGAGDMPFIMGELSRNISREWVRSELIDRMNEIFYEVAEELPNCAVASSMGLSMKDDGIHFSAPALRVFGRRYFNEYKKLRGE
jgi:hypothetical protein